MKEMDNESVASVDSAMDALAELEAELEAQLTDQGCGKEMDVETEEEEYVILEMPTIDSKVESNEEKEEKEEEKKEDDKEEDREEDKEEVEEMSMLTLAILNNATDLGFDAVKSDIKEELEDDDDDDDEWGTFIDYNGMPVSLAELRQIIQTHEERAEDARKLSTRIATGVKDLFRSKAKSKIHARLDGEMGDVEEMYKLLKEAEAVRYFTVFSSKRKYH